MKTMVVAVFGMMLALAPRAEAQHCAADTGTFFDFQVDRRPEQIAGAKPSGHFKPYLVQVVIDTTGVPDSATFMLLDGRRNGSIASLTIRDSALVARAWHPVRAMGFRPAQRHGCPVRILLQMPTEVH